jgi:hypothetical protein
MARQFVAMGGDQTWWMRFFETSMSWHELERAETERLGAYYRAARAGLGETRLVPMRIHHPVTDCPPSRLAPRRGR